MFAKSKEPPQVEPQESGPIHNEELEKIVVSTLLTSYNAIVESDAILTPDCFYNLRLQEIYVAIKNVYQRGDAPDMALVAIELAKSGSTINSAEVMRLCTDNIQVFDIVKHASMLREYMIRRKMWEAGYELMSKASTEFYDIETIHNEIKGKIDNLFDDHASEGVMTLAEMYKNLQHEMILNTERKEGELRGTPTGFELIDKKGGLCPGQLIVVGAETSQGKTSFAMALTLSAISHNEDVAFYSMEMMAIELAGRIASMKSGIANTRILNERLSADEIFRVDDSMSTLDMTRLHVDERSTSTFDSIVTSIRMMKMKYDIKGAVIDYLQLINVKDMKDATTREQKIGACAHELKNLAKRLGIWIILISQLSRNLQNPIPTLARLRDSGQIEEAADIVFLIYRPSNNASYPAPYKEKPTQGTALIKMDKGRGVGTGEFLCGFKAENTLFYPIDESKIGGSGLSCQFPASPQNLLKDDTPF